MYIESISKKGQYSQLHQFTTFDNNIASQVKIIPENGLCNLINLLELPGKLENGWSKIFSWSLLRAALNVSGLFLRFDFINAESGRNDD